MSGAVPPVSDIIYIVNAIEVSAKSPIIALHQAIKERAPIEKVASLITPENINAYHENVSAIHLAVGNVELLKLLLAKGAQLEAPTQDLEKSALHLAVEKKDLESVKFLLESKANPNRVSKSAEGTILNSAALSGSCEIFQRLLDANAVILLHQTAKIGSPLSWGVLSKSEEMVKFLLTKCSQQINWKNSEGLTPLMLAFRSGLFAIAKILADAGASSSELNNEGKNVCHMAVESGHLENVKKVFEICKDMKVGTVSKDGETPLSLPVLLSLAVRRGHDEIVAFFLQNHVATRVTVNGEPTTLLYFAPTLKIFKMLLDAGADLNAKLKGRNVLHSSILNGRLDIARYLISEKKVDIHEKGGSDEETALHLAASKGYAGIVQLLLDENADIEARTKSLLTPLFLVARFKPTNESERSSQTALVKFLLDRGADPNQDCGPNGTALHAAASTGNIKVIDMLLDKGAKLDAITSTNLSVLMETIRSKNEDAALYLLQRGAPVEQLCGPQEWTALHYAACFGSVEMMKILVAHGGNIFRITKNGDTCLHFACQFGNEAVALYCLEKGLSLKEKGFNGTSALHVAAGNGVPKIVGILIDKGADVHSLANEQTQTPFLSAVEDFLKSKAEPKKNSASPKDYNRTFKILIAKEKDDFEKSFEEFDSSNDKKGSFIKVVRSLQTATLNVKSLESKLSQLSSGSEPHTLLVTHKKSIMKVISPFFPSHFLTSSFWQKVKALPFDSFSQEELMELKSGLEKGKKIFDSFLSDPFRFEFIDRWIEPVIKEISIRLPNYIDFEGALKKREEDFDNRDISEILKELKIIFLTNQQIEKLGKKGSDLRKIGIDLTLKFISEALHKGDLPVSATRSLCGLAVEKLKEKIPYCGRSLDINLSANMQLFINEINVALQWPDPQFQSCRLIFIGKLSQYHQSYCQKVLQSYLPNLTEVPPSKKQKIIEV